MTSLRFALLVWLVSGGSTAVAAIDCKRAIATPEVNECASIEQGQVEAKLNAVYQRIIKSLERPDTQLERYSEMKASLIAAQRKWVQFREADCDAVSLKHKSGTIRTLMHISCMQVRAETRIKELELYERE